MVIYQIWYGTKVGPAFATMEEALAYLEYGSVEEMERDTRGYGYPHVQKIRLGDKDFMRDR